MGMREKRVPGQGMAGGERENDTRTRTRERRSRERERNGKVVGSRDRQMERLFYGGCIITRYV